MLLYFLLYNGFDIGLIFEIKAAAMPKTKPPIWEPTRLRQILCSARVLVQPRPAISCWINQSQEKPRPRYKSSRKIRIALLPLMMGTLKIGTHDGGDGSNLRPVKGSGHHKVVWCRNRCRARNKRLLWWPESPDKHGLGWRLRHPQVKKHKTKIAQWLLLCCRQNPEKQEIAPNVHVTMEKHAGKQGVKMVARSDIIRDHTQFTNEVAGYWQLNGKHYCVDDHKGIRKHRFMSPEPVYRQYRKNH